MSVASPRRLRSLSNHEPASYRPHPLHGDGRTYVETNCYTDVLVELLHACGYEPLAALGHVVRLDFEGDQWTFFKPPPSDLEALFGIDIHEMQPYRPLPLQISEQLERGRTIIVELDAWYLPDTASTTYRAGHVKTSVAADAIDVESETLRYFHSLGLYELSGPDYRGALRVDGASGDDVLPPYAELVRFDAGSALEGARLREHALRLLRGHLGHRPADNPFERFGESLMRELPGLRDGGEESYHAYAFATVRMAGSGFELAAAHLDWLLGADAAPAVAGFQEVVDGCKVLSFRLARRRPFDAWPILEPLAYAWERAIDAAAKAAG